MELILVSAIFIAGVVSYFVGHVHGRAAGWLEGFQERNEDTSYALRIEGKETDLTIKTFEAHAHLTVHSKLYGTPDWLTHVAFKNFGEAGEFAEHMGKASRDDGWSIFKGARDFKPERRQALLKELGDQLWYIVMLAHELGSSLAEVMWMNIKKRDGRMARNTILGAGDDR